MAYTTMTPKYLDLNFWKQLYVGSLPLDQQEKKEPAPASRTPEKKVVDTRKGGGVNLENAPELIEAGATVLVAGSSVYGAEDLEKRVADFKVL